jgi:membrane-associated phospholipid phosphatase
VHTSEWIAAWYFASLVIPIARFAVKRSKRAFLFAASLGAAGLIVAVSALPDWPVVRIVRDWAPGVYLLAGYWLPGQLYTAPDERLERWLSDWDHRILGPRSTAVVTRLPRAVAEYFELTYLLCYPLVPGLFAILYFSSPGGTASSISDRFWSVVLLAAFVCYGLLPWMPTRPPRHLAGPENARGVRRVNLAVLRHVSIRVNTLPSGHVAASVAAALAVASTHPAVGAVAGLLALSIAIAAVRGRYHYAVDAILGALVAFVAFFVLTGF